MDALRGRRHHARRGGAGPQVVRDREAASWEDRPRDSQPLVTPAVHHVPSGERALPALAPSSSEPSSLGHHHRPTHVPTLDPHAEPALSPPPLLSRHAPPIAGGRRRSPSCRIRAHGGIRQVKPPQGPAQRRTLRATISRRRRRRTDDVARSAHDARLPRRPGQC